MWNLSNREYVELVLDGSLSNLASEMGKHWDQAQAIRKAHLHRTTDHPMPIKKPQLRNPQLLESVQQTIAKIVETTAPKPPAA